MQNIPSIPGRNQPQSFRGFPQASPTATAGQSTLSRYTGSNARPDRGVGQNIGGSGKIPRYGGYPHPMPGPGGAGQMPDYGQIPGYSGHDGINYTPIPGYVGPRGQHPGADKLREMIGGYPHPMPGPGGVGRAPDQVPNGIPFNGGRDALAQLLANRGPIGQGSPWQRNRPRAYEPGPYTGFPQRMQPPYRDPNAYGMPFNGGQQNTGVAQSPYRDPNIYGMQVVA